MYPRKGSEKGIKVNTKKHNDTILIMIDIKLSNDIVLKWFVLVIFCSTSQCDKD